MADAHDPPSPAPWQPFGRLNVIALLLAALAAFGLIMMLAMRQPEQEPRNCRAIIADDARLSCYDRVIDAMQTEPARGATAPKL